MKRAAIAVALGAAVLLAGCTPSPTAAPGTTEPLTPGGTVYTLPPLPTPTPTSSPSATTAATTVTIDPSAVGGTPTAPTARTAISPPPGENPGTTAAGRATSPVPIGPWPKNLTATQVKDAQAALKAYQEYWDLVDRSAQEPSKDWSAEINATISAGAARDVIDGVDYFRAHRLHTTGRSRVSALVSKVAATEITILACVDQTNSDIVNPVGDSVRSDNQPGTLWRFSTVATLNKFVGSAWQVSKTVDDRSKSC